jgi:Peptidase family M1 domain
MILCRVVATILLSVSAAATAQQQPAPPSDAKQPQLRQRPVVAPNPDRPAPPDPLKAPDTLEPAKTPNANALYQALRTRTASGASFKIHNLTLKRDAGELRLTDGTVTLYNEVNGRVTGAVFQGQGVLHIEPPSAMERRQLKIIMKTEVLDQPFTSAVLAFTDDTAKELKAAAAGDAPGTNAMGPGGEMQSLCRKDLHYDLEERLLADIVLSKPGGFFMANLRGPMFSKRLIYLVDPHGAFGVAPEEVGLLTSGDDGYDITLGFGSAAQRAAARAADNATFGISQQTVDVQIEQNGKLTGKATARVTANESGVQVLPLALFPTLRATGAWGPNGESLDFIQEDKERDPDFAIVLKKPLAKGETIDITTAYSGKDAVLDLGNANFAVNGGARESWYPNVRGSFGNFAHYRITFRTPKDVQVVATGNRLRDAVDGKVRVSEWQTIAPIPVAGFNLGGFRTDHSEHNANLQVLSYANTDPSDRVTALSGHILGGSMDTTGMLKRATSEGDAAIQIYTDFFGPLQYDHLALTQQSACTYGQSWPMLVYLPICYFWDSTIQHQLGVLDGDPTYWKVVTAHEVAHQWWGQTVGFGSYRDQWMSEGFADFSASLFLLETNKDMKPYRDFWALERKRLLEKNANGMRPVDVGPVVMGTRLSSSRAGGGVYQSLIYPKGAYILHMLEMMYWTPQYQEKPFKAAMHDFVNTYRNKAATTEDFKAVMEKNMPPWTDIQHNHKLDWFFDAYVYGTEVPSYTVTSSFEKKGDETTAHFKLSQTGVSENFTMMVPLYIEYEDKNVVLLGHATMKGTTNLEQTVNLGKLSGTPKRIVANYNYDILSAN